MLRLRQLFRGPQLFFRLGPPLPQNSEIANVRHVKFRRPWVRKILGTCLLYGAAFHIWSSFVLFELDDRDYDVDPPPEPILRGSGTRQDDDKGQGSYAHQTEEPDQEDPIFIPLGWPRLRKGEFYASSDPEWQQFVKISRDDRKLKSLRDELAAIVLKNASQSSQISHVLGSPLNITGFWLVHHFPYRAPPTYERSGLAICDKGISWVSRPITPEDGDRLRMLLQPLSMALAIRDAYLVFLNRQLSRLKNFANLDQVRFSDSPHLVPGDRTLSLGPRSVDGLTQISQPDTQKPHPSSLRENIPEDSESNQSLVLSSLRRLPLPEVGPGSDLHEISMTFKRRLKESWSRNARTSRRGIFYVAGPIGIKGPKGFCRIEVRGEYDPAAASWTAVSMQLKDLNVSNQRALGGR